jgi:NADPH:quinone reductase-like Zn-dependent oxidoreductase
MYCCCWPLQIAKAQGAFVATTCGSRNTAFVQQLGADRAIDYTKEK